MEIDIPNGHKYGRQVDSFLSSELTPTQYVETLERIETYERFTLLELIRMHKLEKLEGRLYELRVPIAKVKLRFFGVLCSARLALIHVIKKKSQRIPVKELRTAKEKASLFDCASL